MKYLNFSQGRQSFMFLIIDQAWLFVNDVALVGEQQWRQLQTSAKDIAGNILQKAYFTVKCNAIYCTERIIFPNSIIACALFFLTKGYIALLIRPYISMWINNHHPNNDSAKMTTEIKQVDQLASKFWNPWFWTACFHSDSKHPDKWIFAGHTFTIMYNIDDKLHKNYKCIYI